MDRKNREFFVVIFLLLAVFIAGMLAGRWLASSRAGEIEALINENELNTDSYLIEQELVANFEEGNCMLASARVSSLSSELWEIGRVLSPSDAEERLGKENYYFMKMKFHLMQIRTYILFYRLKQHCSNTGSIVLFYFSRDNNESKAQGEILDRLVADYGITVFAIEYGYSEELSFLEEHYGIKNAPSLVIDYEAVLEGISEYEKIEQIIAPNDLK